MKKFIIGIVLLMMLGTNAAYSDWQPCMTLVDGMYAFYCDETNIKYDEEKKIASRFIKIVPTAAMKQTLIQDLKDEGAKDKDIKSLSYMVFSQKFDCRNILWTLGSKIYYDEKGMLLHKTHIPDSWEQITPGSNAEEQYKSICKKS